MCGNKAYLWCYESNFLQVSVDRCLCSTNLRIMWHDNTLVSQLCYWGRFVAVCLAEGHDVLKFPACVARGTCMYLMRMTETWLAWRTFATSLAVLILCSSFFHVQFTCFCFLLILKWMILCWENLFIVCYMYLHVNIDDSLGNLLQRIASL